MSTNRETVRDAMVALLATALVGGGLPVKTVTGNKVVTLEGLTPLVSVLSAGSFRTPQSMESDGYDAAFFLEVQVWVLQAVTGWTNAQAEDTMDDIEKRIADTYQANAITASWDMVEYASATTVTEMAVAGIPYYMERIPTVVRLVNA